MYSFFIYLNYNDCARDSLYLQKLINLKTFIIMKKITLLIALMITSLGFAQNIITNGDFQNGITGWSGSAAIAANVVTSGGNSYFSTTVAAPGNPWDSNLSYVTPMNTSGTAYKLTFQAWSNTARTVIVGIGLNAAPYTAVTQTINLTTTPQTFILNLTSNFADANSRIIFDMGAAAGAVNIDNVVFELNTAPPVVAAPTTAAPTPPARNAADVISIFSNAYSNITIDNWNAAPIWYAPTGKTVADVQIAGNDTKKIEFNGNGFIGVDFSTVANRHNLTSMERFHIDMWTETATLDKSFNLKLSNFNGGAAEANAIEFSTTNASNPALPNPNPGTWISLDMPLSAWTPGARNDIAQFIVTSNLGVVYFDNVYIYKGTALSTEKFSTSSVKMYPNPVKNSLNIEANASINKVSIYNVLGQEVMSSTPNSNSTTLQTGSLQKGVYMVRTDIDGSITTSKMIKE